ncbi:GSCOCT00007868001.2-RA-CDS [Cotesia congregata]|uniref:Cc_K425_456 n=1 Tax=Cotesia congregata TaxID=51543 RepID=A0A8J2HCG6_COTCN|nr:GSCOCT00007868001.2-RA-CDS [Cotesia congregata]CAG5089935.1 Cc_K425_456 [Cotesia congregata]
MTKMAGLYEIFGTNFYGRNATNNTIEISMIDDSSEPLIFYLSLVKQSVDISDYVSTTPFGSDKSIVKNRKEEPTRLYIIKFELPDSNNHQKNINAVNIIINRIERKELKELISFNLSARKPVFEEYKSTETYEDCRELLNNFPSINFVYVNRSLPLVYNYYDTTTLFFCSDYQKRVIFDENNNAVNIPMYLTQICCPEKSNVLSVSNFASRNDEVNYWSICKYNSSGQLISYEVCKCLSKVPSLRWFNFNKILRLTDEFTQVTTHLAFLKTGDNLIFWLSTLHLFIPLKDEDNYWDNTQLLKLKLLKDNYPNEVNANDFNYSYTDFNTLTYCQISTIEEIFLKYNFNNVQSKERTIYAFDADGSTVMFIGLLSHDTLGADHMKNFKDIVF